MTRRRRCRKSSRFSNSNRMRIGNRSPQLYQILCSSPLVPAHQFLRIARHFPSSGAALKFVEYLRSNMCQSEPIYLSSIFQAAFEIAIRERSSVDKLWLLVERSKEMGVPLSINSATLLIRRFDASVDREMSVYNAVEPRLRNVHVWNSLLHVLFGRGWLEDAWKVLDEMLEPESKVSANHATAKIVFEWILNSMMYGPSADEEEIVNLLLRLGERGLIVDYQKLTEVIIESSKKGAKDRSFIAWDLLHCYLKLGGSVEASCCTSMLSWLANEGEFNKFSFLVKEIENIGITPDISMFGTLINQLCKSGRMNESLEMLKKIRDEGVGGVSLKPDVVIYHMIINGFCKLGNFDEGLAFMEKMKAEGHFVPNKSTYNCLIDGFCRAGELNKSLELFDAMKREFLDLKLSTFSSVALRVDSLLVHSLVSWYKCGMIK